MSRRKQVDKRQGGFDLVVEDAVAHPLVEVPVSFGSGTCRRCGNSICVMCGMNVSTYDEDDRFVATGRGTSVHARCRKIDSDPIWPLPERCEVCPGDDETEEEDS